MAFRSVAVFLVSAIALPSALLAGCSSAEESSSAPDAEGGDAVAATSQAVVGSEKLSPEQARLQLNQALAVLANSMSDTENQCSDWTRRAISLVDHMEARRKELTKELKEASVFARPNIRHAARREVANFEGPTLELVICSMSVNSRSDDLKSARRLRGLTYGTPPAVLTAPLVAAYSKLDELDDRFAKLVESHTDDMLLIERWRMAKASLDDLVD